MGERLVFVEDAVKFLSRHYPISLVSGNVEPSDVDYIIDQVAGVLSVDIVDLLVVADLDVSSASDIFAFCQTKPFGSTKMVVVNTTGSATKVQRSLLGILEASEGRVKFIVFSEDGVLPGITSRSQVFRVFNEAQVAQQTKTKVLRALAATSLGEKKILEDAAKAWTTDDTETLKVWACERLSGRYLVFSTEEVESLGLTKKFAQDLLEALGVLKYADPKKAVMSVLMAQILN